jgi:excinuclease UvrABC helicase subunit UvrB
MNTTAFNVSMPEKYAKMLRELQQESELNMSELFRRLIDFYVENKPTKQS